MKEAGFSRLIGSWRLISVRFRMSDNGEVIDEPMEGVSTFDVAAGPLSGSPQI